MRKNSIELICGAPAFVLLDDYDFLADWQSLFGSCAYASAFQSSGFVRSWYLAYRSRWDPVIARSIDSTGRLVGLWLLACDPTKKELVHAGSHQAEYHSWLAMPDTGVEFVAAAWTQLRRHFAFASLRFKYLPSLALVDELRAVRALRGRMAVRICSRPLLKLELESIRASFAKKSNKSRFNRIKKLGKLEFRRVVDVTELDRLFDELTACYDLRQGGINGVSPFYEDNHKRDFYRGLFVADPSSAYVTVTTLDERLIAAFWGAVSGRNVHLGMLIHTPFLAEHSPGKLHVMQLSEHLVAEGKEVLDLTPGGDAWKERFANAHDEVAEVVLYGSAISSKAAATIETLTRWSKRALARANLTADDARAFVRTFRDCRPLALATSTRDWMTMAAEVRIFCGDRSLMERCARDGRVKCDSVSSLVAFDKSASKETRGDFLSSALDRLERGESAYTVMIDNQLGHCGWMAAGPREIFMDGVRQSFSLPDGASILYDHHSRADASGLGLHRVAMGHMLCDAFSLEQTRYVYACAPANDAESMNAIESLGLGYVGSVHFERRFGKERKWTTPGLHRSRAADA